MDTQHGDNARQKMLRTRRVAAGGRGASEQRDKIEWNRKPVFASCLMGLIARILRNARSNLGLYNMAAMLRTQALR